MNICSINNILPNWIATLIQVDDFVEIELGFVEKVTGETLRGTTVYWRRGISVNSETVWKFRGFSNA